MEHTKGPWVYETERNSIGNRRIFAPTEGYTIAILQSHSGDARLISAAPELLEACREAVEYLATLDNTKNMVGPEYGIWHRIMARIAKAEGRES